jgi:hypothetical protein
MLAFPEDPFAMAPQPLRDAEAEELPDFLGVDEPGPGVLDRSI